MPQVIYNIPVNEKEEVLQVMRQERNTVVKERLLAVSMFLDGVLKGDIKKLMHRSANFIGTWISAYFDGRIKALADNGGGDHKSFLTQEQMQLLKQIIKYNSQRLHSALGNKTPNYYLPARVLISLNWASIVLRR